MRNSSLIGRIAALAAVAIAIVAVVVIVLGGGSNYKVHAIFQDASQLVPGDQVEVGGTSIGSVDNIALTPDGRADITLSISDSTYKPLREGTLATVRVPSLTSLANRFVDLRLGPGNAPSIPSGGTISQASTRSAVDLDELFNTLNPQTRKALQNVIQGSAEQYANYGTQAQQAWQYLDPFIASSSALFNELNRDTGRFTNFIVKTGNLFSDVAVKQADLSALIQHLSTTTTALANQHVALGQSIQELPGFMRLANTTFVNLRNALDDLTPLVDASKPVAPKLEKLVLELRPLAQDAVPTVNDLSKIISRPGSNNDLIDLLRLGVPLANVTVGTVQANGSSHPGAFTESTTALQGSTPELAVARPYAVDLTGWFEGYSHPGAVDANGNIARVAPVIDAASLQPGGTLLNFVPPQLRLALFSQVATTGYGSRCPGSMERGAVYYPETGFPCNPKQLPERAMKRILLGAAVVLAAGAFAVIAIGARSTSSAAGTYKIELDNAFGLISGEQFKVAGVVAGTIKSIDLPQACIGGNPGACRALVTVQVTQTGFGSFRSDVFCQSRPQSLIGEYFLNCSPGTAPQQWPAGQTIPVTHTSSTISLDLLNDIMRMPYRERLTLLINELGAAVAGNSQNLQTALQRAVPALTQTDNLLSLLANDSHNLQQLTASSDAVVTALADNSAQVQRFIVEANNAATDTATQQTALKQTFHDLPGFFEQLQPALQKLGAATDANLPALNNLNSSASQIDRLFVNLPPFAHASIPALRSLGSASVTGKAAAQAAGPTVQHLNQFAQPTPELAQNLAIVLKDLDNRGRAVEKDPRSPGGQGFTGLEALLQYAFEQTLNVAYLGAYGHVQAVDAFASPSCSSYATPATIATNLAINGKSYRQCYSWLGPNQAGVNVTDPSNPTAPVPDPGGAPPGFTGPKTSAAKLLAATDKAHSRAGHHRSSSATPAPATPGPSTTGGAIGSRGGLGTSTGGGGTTSAPAAPTKSTPTTPTTQPPPVDLGKSLGQLFNGLLGGGSGSSASGSGAASNGGSSSGGTTTTGQAQQLLTYLLSP